MTGKDIGRGLADHAIKIIGSLIVAGLLALFGVLWSIRDAVVEVRSEQRAMVSRLEKVEALPGEVAALRQQMTAETGALRDRVTKLETREELRASGWGPPNGYLPD